jgi:hypothetical protein
VDSVIVLAEGHCCGEGSDLAGRYQCLYKLAERQFNPHVVGDCDRVEGLGFGVWGSGFSSILTSLATARGDGSDKREGEEVGKDGGGDEDGQEEGFAAEVGEGGERGTGGWRPGCLLRLVLSLPVEADKEGPEPLRNGAARVQRWSMCEWRPSGWGGAYRRIPPSCEC